MQTMLTVLTQSPPFVAGDCPALVEAHGSGL
jgi:hypothetical protein